MLARHPMKPWLDHTFHHYRKKRLRDKQLGLIKCHAQMAFYHHDSQDLVIQALSETADIMHLHYISQSVMPCTLALKGLEFHA
jgi:hypothetical protein